MSAAVQISSKNLLSVLSPSLNPAWTSPSTAGSVTSFSVPPHTLLLLADVDAGSNTPSMVGKVMQWKKAAPEEAERVWSELGKSNEKLRDVFAELSEAAKEDAGGYEREVAKLAGLTAKEVTFGALVRWRDDKFADVRIYIVVGNCVSLCCCRPAHPGPSTAPSLTAFASMANDGFTRRILAP